MQPFSADKDKGKLWLAISCNVDTAKRMRGSRGKTFGWPPGRQVSKHSQEQKLNFCDGCRADGPAEGCWGREATNPKPPKQDTEKEKEKEKGNTPRSRKELERQFEMRTAGINQASILGMVRRGGFAGENKG